jgi:hypothetical protein
VAGVAWSEGIFLSLDLLADKGKGVEFALDSDAGLAFAPLCNEGSGHPSNATFEPEAMLLEFFGNEFARSSLPETELGVAPDLVAHLGEVITIVVYPFPSGLFQ